MPRIHHTDILRHGRATGFSLFKPGLLGYPASYEQRDAYPVSPTPTPERVTACLFFAPQIGAPSLEIVDLTALCEALTGLPD